MVLDEQREILFRGKRRHRPNEWIYGFLIQRSFNSAISSNNDFQCYPVYPKTLGQYTGFKDCNGVKIFEYDIVHCKTYPHLMRNNKKTIRWYSERSNRESRYAQWSMGCQEQQENVLSVGRYVFCQDAGKCV